MFINLIGNHFIANIHICRFVGFFAFFFLIMEKEIQKAINIAKKV